MMSAPDSKVHVANMGPIWGRQDPGGRHVGPMNFAIIYIYVYGADVLASNAGQDIRNHASSTVTIVPRESHHKVYMS